MITASTATSGIDVTAQQKVVSSTSFGTSSSYYFNTVGNYLWLMADVKSSTTWVTFFIEPTISNTGAMNCLDMGLIRKGPARSYEVLVMQRTGATEGTSNMVIVA
jgi:hypothetical protein